MSQLYRVEIFSLSYHIIGIIRYKGEVEGKDGIQFGVELINADGRGNCDGKYAKQRFLPFQVQCNVHAFQFHPKAVFYVASSV